MEFISVIQVIIGWPFWAWWDFWKIRCKTLNQWYPIETKYESILKNPPKESLIPCRGANGTWLPCLRRRNQEKLLWRLITGPIFVLLQGVDSSTHVVPQRTCCLFQNIEFIVIKSIWDNLRCVPVCFFHPVCALAERFKTYHKSNHEGGKKLLNQRKSGI